MMEYTNKYWNMLMPFIKKSLNKRYGKAYTKALIPKADAEYRDMLNRSDDIGRDNRWRPTRMNVWSSWQYGKLLMEKFQ